MTRVRVRQHVNPLSRKYQQPVSAPDWKDVYANLKQPLHLDIGCARGRFILKMATVEPEWNFLGLEIRESLVDEANNERDRLGLKNLHYLYSNVNNSFTSLLKSLPPGILQRVTIQFPDPWFKKRHQKRRVVQPELLEDLATYLPSGGVVFIQSDIEEVALEMRDRFAAHSSFQKQHLTDWLDTNPMPVPTEREIATLSHNAPVYRALFVRI